MGFCDFRKAFAEEKVTRTFGLVVLVMCGCNALLGGYFIVALNNPRPAVAAQINQTYTQRGTPLASGGYATFELVANLLFFSGSAIGSFSSGYILGKRGSKHVVWYSSFISLFGSILCGLAYYVPELLWVGRVACGFGYGMTNVAVSTYLAEISPRMLRGFVLSALPLGLITGVVLSELLGVPAILGTAQLWPYLFTVSGGLATMSAISLPFLPESYRFYYLTMRDDEAARKSVARLRHASKVEQEMLNLEKERAMSTGLKAIPIKQLFTVKTMRNAFFLSFMLQLAQQLAGSTAVFVYSERIFLNAGVPKSFSPYAVVLTGVVSLIVVIPGILLVEKIGRRVILFSSLIPTLLLLIGLTLTIHFQSANAAVPILSIVFVLLFCATFAFGLSSLPSVVPTELFCQEARGKAFALARAVNNLAQIVQGSLFVQMISAMQEYVFLFFAGIMLICLTYFFICLPETKGKTFQEIQVELAHTVVLCRRKRQTDIDKEKADDLTDITGTTTVTVPTPVSVSVSVSESTLTSTPDVETPTRTSTPTPRPSRSATPTPTPMTASSAVVDFPVA